MKISLLSFAFLLLSLSSYAESIEEMEKDCSRAVVGFLKEKGVITGGEDGLCISDLKSLPQIHIGMGSRTFPLGNADQFQVSKKTQDNLQTLREILTGGNDKATVAFTGYADGEQNNIEQFDSRFLAAGETSYTKQELKNKISDTRTLKAVLDLLEKYPENEKIPYDQSKPELKTVQSLIRNYYLANDRAKKVCETAMPQGTDCSKAPIEGFASPALETAGNKQCDARRRAFLSFNLSPSGMRKAKSNNGRFGPHFETPNPTEYQRDIQIAASVDLFSKLYAQTGSTDLDVNAKNIDLVLPPECTGNKKVLENTRDNSKRLLDHVKKSLVNVTDKNFKDVVLKGDYQGIKKKLNYLNDKEDSGKALTPEEQAQMKVITIITQGVDRTDMKTDLLNIDAGRDYLRLSGTLKKVTRTGANGEVETLYFSSAQRNMNGSSYGIAVYDENGNARFVDNATFYNIESKWKRNPNQTLGEVLPFESKYHIGHGVQVANSKYPKASAMNPSTDNFSCFSVASAIEENMQSNNDSLVDASLLVSGEQAKLNVFLDSRAISHLNNDPKRPKGWACTGCGSGVVFNNEGKLVYKPRDYDNGAAAFQAVTSQAQSNSLTMGSLKNLKVFNISRESFGGKCGGSKSVCDCVKELPAGKGELEKLLKHESTQKIAMTGMESIYKNRDSSYARFENTWTLPKPEDNCIFTPPVPHTCQVDPKGRSKESKSNSRKDIVACKILDSLKTKYALAADIDVNKYKNTVLGGSVCKKSLPTSDEGADCGYKSLGTSGASSNATKQ